MERQQIVDEPALLQTAQGLSLRHTQQVEDRRRRALLERLTPHTELAFLFNPSRNAHELLQSINEEFGLPVGGLSRRELLSRLNRFLLEKKRRARRVVLIIDEAQNLSARTLEQVRLLSNLETSSSKLIQIVLLGQPELDATLDSEEMRQLCQRVSVRWSLVPLDRSATFEYVRHRLRVAAGAEREIFGDAALREIHRQSGGVPRRINVLCDRALLAGYARQARQIGPSLVRRAADEIPRPANGKSEDAPRAARRRVAVAAVAASLLAIGSGLAWRGGPPLPPLLGVGLDGAVRAFAGPVETAELSEFRGNPAVLGARALVPEPAGGRGRAAGRPAPVRWSRSRGRR